MARRSPPTSTPWRGPWRCWSLTSGASRIPVATRLACCPPPSVPVFQRYPGPPSLPSRATRPGPRPALHVGGRDGRAALGVLRQVVAIDGGRAGSRAQPVFTPELGRRSGPADLAGICRYPPSTGPIRRPGSWPVWPRAPPASCSRPLMGCPTTADVNFQRARAHLELGEWQRAAEIVVAAGCGGPVRLAVVVVAGGPGDGRRVAQRCRRGLRQSGGGTAWRAGPPARPGHGC